MANVSAIASSATAARLATTSGWNFSMRLDALEVVEGLEAGVAAVERLAGRRTELAAARRAGRAAARTGDRRIVAPEAPDAADRVRRRRDAVRAELAAAFLAQPVAGPRRRE